MNRVEPNRNVYIGHRYVPLLVGEWDKSIQYEGLSIVTYKGASYTSKKMTPAGIDIENKEYWVLTGNYNAQIEYYRLETERVSDDLAQAKIDLNQRIDDTVEYVDDETSSARQYVDNETASARQYVDNSIESNEKFVNDEIRDLKEITTPAVSRTNGFISSLEYGILGDGSDETEKFQNLLDENTDKTIIVSMPENVLKIGQMEIPSKTNLIFSYGMTVEVTSGLQDRERWFNIDDVDDVTIYAPNTLFRMLKDEYTEGEHRHGFNIIGNSSNITIEGATINGSGGDGFYVGMPDAGSSKYPKNVQLLNVVSENNRRQGLSITTVDGFYAERSIFKDTSGTPPRAGVDIEPNTENAIFKNVKFVDCQAIDNAGSGFVISLMRLTEISEPIDIIFENCKTRGNVRGFYPVYCMDNVKGSIKFIDCESVDERLNGFCETDLSSSGVDVQYIRCKTTDGNTNGGTSIEFSHGANFAIISLPSSPFNPEKIGGSKYIDCQSFEYRSESNKTIRRGFSLPMENTENVVFENCKSTGHMFEEFNIDSENENIIIKNDIDEKVNYSTSGNVTNSLLGKIITNKEATGYTYRRLPEGKEGMIFKFRVESDNDFKITPQPDGLIYPLSNDVNRALTSNSIGSMIELEGRNDGNWTVKNVVGVWEADEHRPL